MKMLCQLTFVLLFMTQLCAFVLYQVYSENVKCKSPQFLELGRAGIVHCFLGDPVYGAFWYNSTKDEGNRPVLYYSNFTRSGRGYDSGEFDINANGSLIINNVTLQHEHTFRVYYQLSKDPTNIAGPSDVEAIVIGECNLLL